MGKLMMMESWFGRMRRRGRKKSTPEPEKALIGVLSFEVASLMSKAIHLWHSLADDQIVRMRDEVLHLDGVRKLVSDDDDFLLGLALSEMMDSLAFLARAVARLGKRCADPVLQRFEHVFADLIKNDADLYGWEYAGKKMERKVKKMERFVGSSGNLYQELEVLSELEQGLRRMQGNAAADPSHQGAFSEFRRKVVWQRHEVKRLREVSLSNRSYDYTTRLLARSLFTIVGRMKHVFGFDHLGAMHSGHSRAITHSLPRCHSVAGLMHSSVHPSSEGNGTTTRFSSGPLGRSTTRSGPITSTNRAIGGQCFPHSGFPPHPSGKRQSSKTKWPVSGGSFRGCMVGGHDSPILHSCISVDSGFQRSNAISRTLNGMEDGNSETQFQGNTFNTSLSLSLSKSRHKSLNAPPSTLGAAALALHYANVIIVIEKLVMSPHLIGPDARDDLYDMLPTSIRAALRGRLKSYAKNLASSVYDPTLAAEWSDALTRILEWLAPLAHNMIRWHSERNFEQQHLVSNTTVLLLQTLHFANQMKTEAAITELLVGLNYLWRFGRELNTKAILECVSSRNFDDRFDSKG